MVTARTPWLVLSALAITLVIALIGPQPAQAQATAGVWPQWRGPNRDGINAAEKNLARKWPEAGPPKLWEVDHVGVGYSSLAIADGRMVTQGDLNGVEHIICLREKDGAVLWSVQPQPVAKALADKLASELKRLDKDGDTNIDEAEALAGLGWQFNMFDTAGAEDPKTLARERAARLLKKLDADNDSLISFAEAGNRYAEKFASVDAPDKAADAAALAAKRTDDVLKADKNSDSQLDKQEVKNTPLDRNFGRADQKMPGSDKGDEKLTKEEILAYFTKFEAGSDGQLTAGELADYYARVFPGRDGRLTQTELKGYFGGFRNDQGDGPRGTPTIDGERVYVEGGNGDLTCLDVATGKTLWHKNLVTDFKGGRPGWGYSESPLVLEGLLIVTPGGNQGTLVALDKLSGETVWRSAATKEGAHYSSPVVAEIAGVRQIVQFASKSCFGVTATSGEPLWSYSKANNGTANCTTPIVHAGHVFASSSYGTGGGLAKITGEAQKQQAEEVYFDKQMANHHGGIVRVGDYMYGFGNPGLMCMNFLTGEVKWKARSVRKGSLVVADGLLFLLGEGHEVGLAEATPDEYRELGKFKIESLGRPSWAHPVVAAGRMYIRNQGKLTAYDVRSAGAE